MFEKKFQFVFEIILIIFCEIGHFCKFQMQKWKIWNSQKGHMDQFKKKL